MQTRTATAIVLVTLLALVPAIPAASEPAPGRQDAASALAQVRPGVRVRIQGKDGRVVEGRYIEIADGDVVLDEPAARISAASIQRVSLRGRAARKGAIIGGTILGTSGALLGLLVAAYCASENECGGGVWLAAPAGGLGIGAAAGALTGGLVGAAIPKWHRLDRSASTPPRTNRAPVVVDRAGPSAPGGLGGRVGLTAELPGGFAPGLETGRFVLGHGQVFSPRGRAIDFNESVSHFSLSLTKTRDRGWLKPYGVAGFGYPL